MNTLQATVYECECCHQLFIRGTVCLDHETGCFEDERQRAEYDRKYDEATDEALNLAQADIALRTLVAHECGEAARYRARDLLDEMEWKPGCSSWHEAIVRRMLEAAAREEE